VSVPSSIGAPAQVLARVHVLRLKVHWSDRVAHAMLVVGGCALALFLLAPMAMILAKSVQDRAGDYVGLANFVT